MTKISLWNETKMLRWIGNTKNTFGSVNAYPEVRINLRRSTCARRRATRIWLQ